MLAAVSVWMAHRSSCEQRVEVVESEAFVVVDVLSSVSVGRSVGSAGVSAWGGGKVGGGKEGSWSLGGWGAAGWFVVWSGAWSSVG